MDSLRHIITSSTLHPAGPDSGIDACCNSASCTSGSQPHPVDGGSSGGGGVSNDGIGTGCGHTSQSEATSAIHDLSVDVNDLLDDSPRTEDEAVSDDDGAYGELGHSGNANAMDHSGSAVDCLEDLHALQIHVEHSDDGGEHDAPLDNNRLFHQRVQLRDRGRMASKEEKQRQNEEIVTGIVSSSVSSETGSWESVFPQRTPTATLGEEATAAVEATIIPPAATAVEMPANVANKSKEVRLPDFQFCSRQSTSSAASACFIDASSLMDESELQLGPQLPEVGCCGPKPEEPLDPCEQPEVVADLHSPNLSDEQKLLHRVGPEPERNVLVDYDIKDQFASGPSSLLAVRLDSTDGVEPPASLDTEPQASASDPEFRHRQDLERKQGHFLFRNSIQHYSGSVHVTPVRQMYHDRDDAHSDMSLPSVYSTGSGDLGPPASLDPIAMGQCSFSEPESGFYPDTPHNSIVHVDIPLVPVHIASQAPIPDNDRMRPGQVEGPATIYRPPFDSPSVRRKTETCPILSGGLQTEDLQDESSFKMGSSFKEKPLSASLNSWVVDMSDCRSPKSERRRLDSVSSITSANSNNSFAHSLDTKRPSGTGFFVNLSDCASSLPPNLSSAAIDAKRGSDEAAAGTAETEKKNIFSMFIDFGDKKPINRREPISFTSRLSMAMQRQNPESTANSSDTESDRGDATNSKPPAVVRRTPTAARRLDPRNRHSWNEPPNKNASSSTDRRRAEYTSSLSMPNGDSGISGGIMSILDKIPLISKTSSMSADSPQSPLDDLTTSCSKSMSVYSNNSGKSMTSAEEDIKPEAPVRRRRQDVEINETFDKSSRSSLPEEQLSTDTSPITDTDDVTFQNELDVDPLLDTILEQDSTVDTVQRTETTDIRDTQTMESLQAIIERQQNLLLETVAEEPAPQSASSSAFVKLSDMDKPALKFELHSAEGGLSKSVGAGASRIERLFGDNGRQHRSGRSSAHPMSRSTGNNNLTTLASSSDNLKSLTRLFPHLSKELSNSMPTDIQVDESTVVMHKSPASIMDYQELHDLSAASSVTSSFSRSAIDSADESSLSYRQPRRLGEDLLKMFLQEIATDVTLEVAGRRMRAHKCILRSRCQYFAAILAGNWVQAAGNVITLPGYSYGAVHFALCHIYSGAAHPPEGISLIELAALADLLGLEGLKEVTAYALRTHYCHNFHKPCSGCIDGILQVFPVTLNHGLDDLYRKCLRWTCRHYVKVWPTRAFSQLPADIVARCSQHLTAHMNSETVLDTILDCDHLLTLVAPCRWAIGIENTIRDIIDTAHAYLADHFASLIASDGFLSLGQGQSWNISRLEHLLLRTATTLTPEQACRSYQRVTRLNAVLHARSLQSAVQTPTDGIGGLLRGGSEHAGDGEDCDEIEWNVEFLRLVDDVLNAVQHCLVNQCGRAMRTTQWQRMDLDLRRKIQKLACLTEPAERRVSQLAKPMVYQSLSSGNVPHALTSRMQDLNAVKLAIQAQTKRAQESVRHREPHRTAVPPPERPTSLHLRGSTAHDRHAWQPSAPIESRSSTDRRTGRTSQRQPQSTAPQPDLIPTNTSIASKPERPTNLIGHRRTQSESNNARAYKPTIGGIDPYDSRPSTASRLAEIRPRYLEPKPQKRLSSSATAAASHSLDQQHAPYQPLGPHHAIAEKSNLSSSDSSTRTSKQGLNNKRLAAGVRSNLSRDSLSSPAKHAANKRQAATVATAASEVDLSVDSLGGSMHSSIRSNKSVSQESLHLYNATVRANNAAKTAKALAANNQIPHHQAASASNTGKATSLVSRLRKPTPITSRVPASNNLAVINTTGSASTTAKSSRLPSVNSATSSPRDAPSHASNGNTMRTASAPGTGPAARKSFLSARTKEILASKKAVPNRSADSVTMRSATATCIPTSTTNGHSPNANNAVNKSSSTSAIQPNKRPVSFPTTLHLRRTAKLMSPLQTAAAGDLSSQASSKSPRSPLSTKVTGKFARTDPKRESTSRNQRIRGTATMASTVVEVVHQKAVHQQDLKKMASRQGSQEDADDETFVAPRAATRVESKLERSSTFCKESSTLGELQIIE